MLSIKNVDYFFSFLGVFLLLGAVIPSLLLGGDGSSLDINEGLFLFQFLLSLVFLFSFIRAFRSRAFSLKLGFFPLLIFIIFCCISIMWSVDSALTLRRSISLIGSVLFAYYVVFVIGFRFFVKVLIHVMVLTIFISFIFALFFKSYGVHNDFFYAGAWKGAFLHKNLLGRESAIFCSIFFILFLFETHTRKYYYLMFVFLSFVLVVMAGSVTGILSTLFALSLSYVMYKISTDSLIRYHLLIFVIPLFFLVFISFIDVDFILSLFGRDSSFTGRDLLWETISEEVSSRPLLGFGYQSFWSSGFGEYVSVIVGYRVVHAHSGYYETLLSLGYVGVFVVAFMYLFFVYLNFELYLKRHIFELNFSFLIVVLIITTSISDSLLIGPNNFLFFLFVVLYFSAVNKLTGSSR